MDGRLTGVTLLLGACLLGAVLAAEPNDHKVCNVTAVTECLAPYGENGVLKPLINLVEANYSQVFTSVDVMKVFCKALGEVGECLRTEERKCFNMDDPTTVPDFSGLAGFPVPTSDNQIGAMHEICNNRTFCDMGLATCVKNHSAVIAYLTAGSGSFNASICQSIKTILDCISEDLPRHCGLTPSGRQAREGISLANDFCREVKCPALQQCRVDFEAGGPMINGLNHKTCFLYQNFTGCASDAVAGCSQISLPVGTGSPALASELVYEACTAMGQENITAIYNCQAFSDCVNDAHNIGDTLLLPNLCWAMQAVVSCAAQTVESCVSSDVRQQALDFEKTANALMLKAEARGCGRARISVEKCKQLDTCVARLTTAGSFDQVCTSVKTFQECGDRALIACNLTRPAPSPGVKVPRLAHLSTVTQQLCTAMAGQALSSCSRFKACLEDGRMPEVAWEYVSGETWCGFSVHLLECALNFSGNCTVADSLRTKLKNVYQDFLDQGCENTYDFHTGVQPTTDPTGGAQTLVAVPLMVLLLSFLNLL